MPRNKKGIKWDFSVEKYYYEHQKNDEIKERNNAMVATKYNDIDNVFHLYSAEAIAEVNINKNLYLESGLQFSDYKNKSNNISTAITDKNDNFVNKEKRYASFINARLTKQSWKINVGLRWEMLLRDANINKQSIVNKITYDFSPNISVGKDLNDKLNLKAWASRKLKRPSFQQLNPAITYIDSLSIMQGNPNLKKEVINLYSLKLSFMKFASLSMYYKYVSDAMIWFVEGLPHNTNISRGMQINIPKQNIWGMDAVLPYQNKYLTFYLATGWQFMKNKSKNYKHLEQFSWYLKSGLDVNLPYGIKANITGLYFSDGINGIWYYDNAYQVDAQVQKHFLNKRLSVSLSANDIFRSNKIHSRLNISNNITDYTYYKDNQFISLRISYTLNSNKNKSFKKLLLQDARNRIDAGME